MGSYTTPSGASIQNIVVDPSPSNSVVTETSFGQASSAGVSGLYSRGDHTHGTPTAPSVPSASGSVTSETSFGQASSAGAASTFSRGDHTHGTPAAETGGPSGSVVSETSFGQASSAGASSTYSRGDHTHGTPANPGSGFTSQSSGGRSLNNTYQNVSGKTMMVTVAALCQQVTSPANDAYIQAKTDAGNPPGTVVGLGGHAGDNAGVANDKIYASVSFMVLNNNFYRVESVTGANGVVNLQTWTEWS